MEITAEYDATPAVASLKPYSSTKKKLDGATIAEVF